MHLGGSDGFHEDDGTLAEDEAGRDGHRTPAPWKGAHAPGQYFPTMMDGARAIEAHCVKDVIYE